MKSILFFAIAILGIWIASCEGNKPTPAPAPKAEVAVNPPPTDAKSLLLGKWQSAVDAKSIMEITAKNVENTYDGKKLDVRVFEYVADCGGAACVGGAGKSGCFTSAGQMDIECYSIVSISATVLEVSMVGATGNTLKYLRMK